MTGVYAMLAFLVIVAGMATLAVGMKQHYRQVFGVGPRRWQRLACRALGWLLLAAALVPCWLGWGASMGSVLWSGLLAGGVLVVAGALAAWPQMPGTK